MRRALTSVAMLLAGAVALVGPAVAEWSALQAVRAGVARCPDGVAPPAGRPGVASSGPEVCGGVAQVDVDVGGLRLWHPWREQAGLHVDAEALVVSLGSAGVQVDATALQLRRVATPGHGGRNANVEADANLVAEAIPSPPSAGPRRSPLHTRGIPVHVRVQGSTTWSQAGVELTLGDPALALDGHGGATASFTLAARARGIEARGTERWTATALDGSPRHWRAEGPVELAGGPATPAVVTVSREAFDLELHDPQGGRLAVHAPRPRGARSGSLPSSVHLQAERFAWSTLGRLGADTLARWGVHPEGIRLDAAVTVDGVGPDDDAGTAEIERLRLDGLVIESPKLAREPVELDALELQGELGWRGDEAAGTGWVAHRKARLLLSAQLGPEAFDLRTELAPLPCQALLDAFPAAMSEMVAGTTLHGELQAHAELHLDRAALTLARARGALDPEHPTLGRLDFAFPFLERCTVTADDPRLDLAALSGPYRHRFVDDRGHEQRRVMAPGAPGFVALGEVPRLARAFVVLEDRRFWQHDGFDREQIEHALWHNLVQGRVSRGASTISQQAARNLWLGVDRSWGRKLQEALLTARLEASTDKARIMELYLNVIELGSGTHGVDEAAQLYFGKPAAALSVLQSIHLAALAPAPRRYAERFEDGQVDAAWLDMLHEHVRRMHRAGLISGAQQEQALREDLGLLDRR